MTTESCLLGAVILTKNANIDRYKYSRYCIEFNKHGFYSHPKCE